MTSLLDNKPIFFTKLLETVLGVRLSEEPVYRVIVPSRIEVAYIFVSSLLYWFSLHHWLCVWWPTPSFLTKEADTQNKALISATQARLQSISKANTKNYTSQVQNASHNDQWFPCAPNKIHNCANSASFGGCGGKRGDIKPTIIFCWLWLKKGNNHQSV